MKNHNDLLKEAKHREFLLLLKSWRPWKRNKRSAWDA